jgi:hypothetical protein
MTRARAYMPQKGRLGKRWRTRWTAIEGVRGYFDKITEELVDSETLTKSQNP